MFHHEDLSSSLYSYLFRSRSRSGERYRWGSSLFLVTSVSLKQGNLLFMHLSLWFSGKEEAHPPIALVGTVRMESGNERGRGNTDTKTAIALAPTRTGAKGRGTRSTSVWPDLHLTSFVEEPLPFNCYIRAVRHDLQWLYHSEGQLCVVMR